MVNATGQEIYEFGEFALDVVERRLARGNRVIPLEPKAHNLLVALVRRGGRLVSRPELLQEVWPDAHVEEGIVSVHVEPASSARRSRLHRNGLTFRLSLHRRGGTTSRHARRHLDAMANRRSACPTRGL